MNLLKSNLCLTAVLICALPFVLTAIPAKEFTKVVEKEYPISRDGTVGIVNKYGSIDIRTWDAARVKIEVTIKVDARSEETANQVFDRISIKFENTASAVRAMTEIASSTSSWKSWFNWGGSNSDKFEINYIVYTPASVALELDNKYGDIFTADMKNRAAVNLRYGKGVLGEFTGPVSLNVGYGKGSLRGAGDLNFNVSYSDFQIDKVANVQLNAKYSNIQIAHAANVNAVTAYVDVKAQTAGHVVHSGKYDDMSFAEVQAIEGNAKYTGYKIGTLHKSATLNMGYGSLNIGNVVPGFSRIEINSQYTDVAITVDKSAAFHIEANTKYCGINHSGIEMYHSIEKTTDRSVKGFRGSRDASSRIVATMSYGKLHIQ